MGIAIVCAVVAGFIILAIVIYIVTIYNGLVLVRVNVDKAWSNIDVLLKKRHDLIPNLVAVVEGYKNFERQVLTQVTEARSASMKAQTVPEMAAASGVLSGALSNLFAVAENYPQLKAGEQFLSLQKSFSGVESEIADRREFYNDSVATYNTRIAQFPDTLVAGATGFRSRDMFKVEEGDKTPITVALGGS